MTSFSDLRLDICYQHLTCPLVPTTKPHKFITFILLRHGQGQYFVYKHMYKHRITHYSNSMQGEIADRPNCIKYEKM